MTTTAFDDQFTDAPEPVHQPYDTSSILRRNVADLELALKQQTERAEAAEAELLAVREDNHSMMLEIDGLRKELARLREQEPVAYVKYKATGGNVGLSWFAIPTQVYCPREGEPLYAAPVPAPAVPAVSKDNWKRFTDDDLAEIHQLAHELGGTDSGEYLLDGDQFDQVVVKCASLFYAFPVKAAPAVPDNFRAAVLAYLESIDHFNTLNSTVGGGWSTKKAGTHQEIVLAANEMRGRRMLLESLLNPATQADKESAYCWECNECGSQEYTMSVTSDVINSGQLACGNCGCDEFHKEKSRD